VKAGRLLDVKSGEILRDQAIVIENDKIVSVGRQDANTSAQRRRSLQAPCFPE